MQAWTELTRTVKVWEAEKKQKDKGELKTALRAFDENWAQFEHFYIIGLIQIEDRAKKLVRDAILQECKLQECEARGLDSAEYLIEQAKFIQCLSQMNAVANTERKGRTDLSDDILNDALKLWRGSARSSLELPVGQVNENGLTPSADKDLSRALKATSSTTSLCSVKDKVFGILRSVTNSSKSIHSSNKVVRFFPDENDGLDSTSNASTASTEEHHGTACSGEDEPQDEAQESQGNMSAAHCLAGDVVESYWHMRYYLRDISSSLERIDPNLSSNVELVSRLEDWEESWEVGREYVSDGEMLHIVCDLVRFLQEVERVEPAFAEMTQECGAEFCLCLPRLIWLHFLQDPKRHMKLFPRFLPHRFPSNTEAEASDPCWDSCIQTLLNRYEEAERELVQLSKKASDDRYDVNRLLVQNVIAGPNSESQPSLLMELDLGPKSDSGALVHAIEERSMELQRHRPEDWNHFMMVIVRCFSRSQPKHRQRMGPKAPVPKLPSNRGRRGLWRSRPRLRTMPFPAVACPARNSR